MPQPTSLTLPAVDGPASSTSLRFNLFNELGTTGLKRHGFDRVLIEDEEFLPQLRGQQKFRIYREMSHNDAIIYTAMRTIKLLLKGLEFRVDPFDDGDEHEERAEFITDCKDDMWMSWQDTIGEILSFLVYGFSVHELVYKRRQGFNDKRPKQSSKFDDNKIGWGGWPVRAQDTISGWMYDRKSNELVGYRQRAAPVYEEVPIALAKSLLFRNDVERDNPEGVSSLRGCFRAWWFLKRLQELEGVSIDRDGAGLPFAKVPSEWLSENAQPEDVLSLTQIRQTLTHMRRDSKDGIIIPSDVDPDTKVPAVEIGLMNSGGSRQIGIQSTIERWESRIAMVFLQQFLLLGQSGGSGSYALSANHEDLFSTSLEAVALSIADPINRWAIPRLMKANEWDPGESPKMAPGEVNKPAATELTQAIQTLAGAGMPLFPDNEFEAFVRETLHWPEIGDEAREAQMFTEGLDAETGMPLPGTSKDPLTDSGGFPLGQERPEQGSGGGSKPAGGASAPKPPKAPSSKKPERPPTTKAS